MCYICICTYKHYKVYKCIFAESYGGCLVIRKSFGGSVSFPADFRKAVLAILCYNICHCAPGKSFGTSSSCCLVL